ncbi:MAG: hypothetical protein ACP5O2_05440 [Bacteroidales bacterium]
MSAELPFTEHPQLRLLKFAALAISGLERLMTVFYNPSLHKLQAYLLQVDDDVKIPEPLDISQFYDFFFARRRETKTTIEWLVPEDLPFETPKSNYTPALFDELKRTILLLKIPSPDDKSKDLLYLFFDSKRLKKGIHTEKDELDTVRKEWLGEMALNVCKAALENFQAESIHFKRFVDNTRFLAQKIQEERSRLESMRKSIGQSLFSLALDIAIEFSGKTGSRIKFSGEAESLIRSYAGDIVQFRKAISDACVFAYTLGSNDAHELMIHDWHIHLESTKERKGQISTSEASSDEKMHRTLELLNRLEFAAHRVIEQNLPMTGKNLGHFCERPISAPAISDALKKHNQRIKTVMEQYPDRWPLLREHFSPLRQILQPRPNQSGKKAAG